MTTSTMRPVAPGERIEVLDVLRGFALCGVLLANMTPWFSGTVFLGPEQVAARPLAELDRWVEQGIRMFVHLKFITIFSFLFGLGFAVQLIRAEERGAAVERLYIRRLLALLLIGATHALLIWFGDILVRYAVMGMLLVLFRRSSDRVLLWSGLLLMAAAPVAVNLVLMVPPLLTAGAVDVGAYARRISDVVNPVSLHAITEGGYLDVLRANFVRFRNDWLIPGFAVVTIASLGKFLLGFLAGRRRYFHDPAQHLPLLRKLFVGGLLIGLAGNAVWTLTSILGQLELLPRQSWWRVAAMPFTWIGVPALSLAYVSGITLLFVQRASWRQRLGWFAPIGRMALTNYLSQSVIGVLLFYDVGLGLWRTVGSTLCIPIMIAVVIAQRQASVWWLARYRFGPAEWVWRTLAYGARQPLRNAAPEPVPTPAGGTSVSPG